MVERDRALNLGHFLRAGFILNIRHFVEQTKDALAAGDGALNGSPQHRDLLNRSIDALDVGQEGDHRPDRDGRSEQRLVAQQ